MATREKKLERIRRIYARDGRRCWWCGRLLLPIGEIPVRADGKLPTDYPTLDHLTPQCKKGTNTLSNLVVSCPPCNSGRGNTVAPYVPIDDSAELRATTVCPDCENGIWMRSDGRVCPTCEGAGELSAGRAVTLFLTARAKARKEASARMEARAECARLRTIIDDEFTAGSYRRDLAHMLKSQREQIKQMAERILELKVELAEATGADLAKMVPMPNEYKKALAIRNGNGHSSDTIAR